MFWKAMDRCARIGWLEARTANVDAGLPRRRHRRLLSGETSLRFSLSLSSRWFLRLSLGLWIGPIAPPPCYLSARL